MGEFPPLQTERLRIIPFSGEHLSPRYVGWLNDSEVVRYSEQRHYHHTLESCRSYWKSFHDTPHYFLALVTRDSTIGHIGNLTVTVDHPNAVADMAILLGEKAVWQRGYGAEAWRAVMNRLLTHMGLRKVTAGTMAENKGMLGIMRRTGMIEEGRRKRQFFFECHEVDLVYGAQFSHGETLARNHP